MVEKICCIFNLAPHYNAATYTLMDKALKCDFYFGDRLPYSVELMNYESLKGFKKRLKYKSLFGNFYWQQGAISLAFKSYKHYIITGEPHCVSSWLVLFFNRLNGRKSYLWTHGWYGNEKGLKKTMKKLFFALSDKILLYGDYARNLMVEEGFNPEKLLTIYNSLDYDKQVSIRNKIKDVSAYKHRFKNEYPVLLYIGRIQNRKKIELLIEALKALHKNHSFCNLILIGSQTDKTTIHQLVSSYELDKFVWFFGPCYEENILGELIYAADVCVSPGNVGLTAMHSLVYGTPVITQDNFVRQMPEFEAITAGLTGDFFKEDSVEDLYRNIIKWTSQSQKQRALIRKECYKVIDQKYNPHKQIEVLKKAISSLNN